MATCTCGWSGTGILQTDGKGVWLGCLLQCFLPRSVVIITYSLYKKTNIQHEYLNKNTCGLGRMSQDSSFCFCPFAIQLRNVSYSLCVDVNIIVVVVTASGDSVL